MSHDLMPTCVPVITFRLNCSHKPVKVFALWKHLLSKSSHSSFKLLVYIYITLVLTYGAHTWAHNKQNIEKLKKAQRAMEQCWEYLAKFMDPREN